MFVSRLIQGVGDQNLLIQSSPKGYGTHYSYLENLNVYTKLMWHAPIREKKGEEQK